MSLWLPVEPGWDCPASYRQAWTAAQVLCLLAQKAPLHSTQPSTQTGHEEGSLLSPENAGLSWWLRWYRICLQCRRPGFDPCIRKIPWQRKWQPTPVLLPGELHRQRSLAGYSPWGCKESTRLSDEHLTPENVRRPRRREGRGHAPAPGGPGTHPLVMSSARMFLLSTSPSLM